jgi:predicted ATPase/class 3 adenylate cyclase/DNA-binding CsgD family transcriptional regulator
VVLRLVDARIVGEPENIVTDLSEFRGRADRPAKPAPGQGEARALPVGTVTFLLTDIEGSTRAFENHGPEMARAVARHYDILDAAVSGHHGVRPVEQGEGDSLVAAFPRASDAVAAALKAQQGLTEEDWPQGAEIRVRMAIHTGEAQLRDERFYIGPTIIRCARLRGLAHGGQVLVSNTTADLLADALPAGAALLPLGHHRLRDLRQPERVFQLAHPGLVVRFPPLRSLDTLPNNLPAQLTSFVGREAELAEVATLLASHRLVTLVGAGGCGKTRLAAQVAADGVDAYPDGVWWVELSPVADPDLVPRAVMGSLGLGIDRGLEPLDRIVGYLGDQRILLVLDNCEHVLPSVARTADGLLRGCPNVTVMATSREPLGVPGEVDWRVPPLSLPADGEQSSVLGSEGVRLFIDRAVEARPTFRADSVAPQTLAAICTRLDGLPLAIELAAARVRSLSPDHILGGLGDRFRLLTGGARTAVARQQTLQASVEWSHALLTESERTLFRRLAAFSGGFGLEAAETVCAGGPLEKWEIVAVLSDLVDKSLVVFDGDRYRLLQTIHDFASAQLLASGEAIDVRDRHAAYYLELAEAATGQLDRTLSADLLSELEADHDNLRGALEWAMVKEDDPLALRLLVAFGFFWFVHGHYSEGLTWHRRVLARIPAQPSALRAKAVWCLGHLSLNCFDLANGYGTGELAEAVELARQLGDPALLTRPLADQGAIQVFVMPIAAQSTLEEAIDAARRSEDQWALSHGLWWLAFYWAFACSRPDMSEPVLGELRSIAQRRGNPYWPHWGDLITGGSALHEGRLSDARTSLEHALAGAYDFHDPMLESYTLTWLADVQIAQGDYDDASALAAHTGERLSRSLDACRQSWVEFLGLAGAALARGDLEAADRHTEVNADLIRESGLPLFVGRHAMVRGRVALERGNLAAARTAFGEAEGMVTQADTPWSRVELHHGQALLARLEGDLGGAEDLHQRALTIEVQYRFRGAAAGTLEALASLATAGESHAEAARLFGAAQALREATGQVRWPIDQPSHEADLANLRAQLGDEGFEEAWKEGTALSLEEAAAYASRARGERKRPSTGWGSLTPTEVEVVALAAQGLSNAEIGRRLFISAGTAKVHLSHVYAKLGVANRVELAAQASARGLGRS